MIGVPVGVPHLADASSRAPSAAASTGRGVAGIDHRGLAAGGIVDQPQIIVGEGRDRDDLEAGRVAITSSPVLGIDAHGSAGASASPFWSSSTEMPSGERTNAMWPSRGGRLIVTPASASRRAGRVNIVDAKGEVAEIAPAVIAALVPIMGQLDLGDVVARRRGRSA